MTSGKAIWIEDYRCEWEKKFDNERRKLMEAFGDELVHIEHMGSTSVKGLAAKPVIDIMVGVRDLKALRRVKDELQKRLYREVETTMPNRLFFQKEDKTVHLHIVPCEGFHERNELLFRDYLRRNPEAVEAYAAIKRQKAEEMGNDHEGYTKAKTDFIQSIVDLACDERRLPRRSVWEE